MGKKSFYFKIILQRNKIGKKKTKRKDDINVENIVDYLALYIPLFLYAQFLYGVT